MEDNPRCCGRCLPGAATMPANEGTCPVRDDTPSAKEHMQAPAQALRLGRVPTAPTTELAAMPDILAIDLRKFKSVACAYPRGGGAHSLGAADPQTVRLRTVPGVGPRTAE